MLGEAARLAAERVPGVAIGDPGEPKTRPVVDVAQCLEAALDLVVDPLQAGVVFALDVAGNTEQVLVSLPLPRSPSKCPRRDSNPRRAA